MIVVRERILIKHMNKQQLASKIWESANKMRSKIEANEYKDYILGFIFYKFLSDKETKFLIENDFTNDEIKTLTEKGIDDLQENERMELTEKINYIQKSIGYYISYDNLFSTWIEMKGDFDVANVRDGLSAFNRYINPSHQKVFNNIFNTLETGLSKLGDTSGSQTKAISELIKLIKDIPMDGKQDYDVLGFIYEYLIGMFAANAGKKAGEFYTPHEVSLLMSEIVADHVKERKEIKIYDPTSGSGSLLINIGRSVAKYIQDENNIKYYAQELKLNTYNLTRMNLVMRGILPDNIVTRNGDTLEDDWPYFEENDPVNTYDPLYVDAVVSNPPYSQAWDPSNKETDPRYARFGLAPKGKADYAFLLHDLFHLKSDGIMTIVLPHGVLFRGGEEGTIRKNLIEQNHIDTIIGLPANIFFGTGIPTIIMVLKQKRKTNDVLIIDASKGFKKVGKNNQLQASDIKKIVDVVKSRSNVQKYSKVVTQDEIRENDYNLNIPRYVDSSDETETWDIYSSMFGGIPKSELSSFNKYWDAFPNLRNDLFKDINAEYCELKTDDIKNSIINNYDIKSFFNNYQTAFSDFNSYLRTILIDGYSCVNIAQQENIISEDIFKRLYQLPLIDKYMVYQALDDEWSSTSIDLEILQTEGIDAARKVDPNYVIKKKNDKETEIQEGWKGHVFPFELIQKTLLIDESNNLSLLEQKLSSIQSESEEITESFTEDEKESSNLFDSDKFINSELNNELKNIYDNIETDKIKALNKYLDFLETKPSLQDKLDFISNNHEIAWDNIEKGKNGTFAKNKVKEYVAKLQSGYKFDDESYEQKVIRLSELNEEEKAIKAELKTQTDLLENITKDTIENLTNEEINQLLENKWIEPLIKTINSIPNNLIDNLSKEIKHLSEKYSETYLDITNNIRKTEKELSKMIDELTGCEEDLKGLNELKSLFSGD